MMQAGAFWGSMTKEFVVALDPRPGTLAELLGGLAKERVNIRGGFGANVGDFDTWHMIVDDEIRAASVLRASGARFQTHDVVTTSLEDRPGELLRACEKIASRGINLQAIYSLASDVPGKASVAFRVNDPRGAEAALRGP